VEKSDLQSLVRERLSIREIAVRQSLSYTAVRYWLRKHEIQTRPSKGPGTNKKTHCPCGETDPKKFYGHKKNICGACHNEYCKAHGKEVRRKVVAYLGGCCRLCKFNKFIAALDVHHLDPKQKDVAFEHLRGWSWERIEEEIKKCVLLCKNCHAGVHSGELTIGE
jgi:hypothetical protein